MGAVRNTKDAAESGEEESVLKDPLQTEQTPYEILGVGPDAGRGEIDKALVNALRKRIPANIAKNARDELLNPVDRAWYDLLECNQTVLGQLNPSVLNEPSALDRSNRMATLQAWEKQFKKKFPDSGLGHSIAVLWYWWAMYEEHRLADMLAKAGNGHPLPRGFLSRGILLKHLRRTEGVSCDPVRVRECRIKDCPWRDDCISPAPPMKDMWERVIGYWVMLAATSSFWNKSFKLSKKEIGALKDRFIVSLQDLFNDLSLRYDKIQAGDNAENYRMLSLALATERQAADSLKKAGMKTKYGKITCGILMLAHMGLLDTARSEVDAVLKKHPDSEALQRLRNNLSPYSSIAILVDQRKSEAALDAIEQLSADEQQLEEIRVFRTRAYHLLAGQMASLDDMNGAIDAWRSALESAEAGELKSKIKVAIVKECHQKAVTIQKNNLNKAIMILEGANRLVRDEGIRLNLADFLLERGVDTINGSVNSLTNNTSYPSQEYTEKVTHDLESGLDDIERAEELGSRDAAKQLGAARNLISQAKSGFLFMPAEAGKLYAEANEAAGRGDWYAAIKCLRKAIEIMDKNVPQDLKEILGICLANRAHEEIDRGFELVKNKSGSYRPSPEGIALIKSGERDLTEAERYDPDSTHVRKNLADVRQILKQLESQAQSMPDEVIELLEAAKKAAKRKDWDQAIVCLRKVVVFPADKIPGNIKNELATLLANRGIDRINRGMKLIDESIKKQREPMDFIFKKLSELASQSYISDDECALCNKSVSSNRHLSWYSVPLPNGQSAPFCEQCKNGLVTAQSFRPTPSSEGITLVQTGERDLAEAAQYDPGNTHVKKNLSEVRKIMTDLDASRLKPEKTGKSRVSQPAQKKSSPGKAPIYKPIVSVARKKRSPVHGGLLLIVLLLTPLVGFGLFSSGSSYLDVWGKNEVGNTATIIGIFILIISLVATLSGSKARTYGWSGLDWRGLYSTCWEDKKVFEKFLEILLYIFIALLALSYLAP